MRFLTVTAPRPPRLPRGRVARKIVMLLRHEPRELHNPKAVARRIGEKKGTVSKEMWRLARGAPDGQAPPIIACGGGYYRAWRDPGLIREIESPTPKLHAIQMWATLPANRGSRVPGTRAEWGDMRATSSWHLDEDNGQYHRLEVWRGRSFRIHYTPRTGTVMVDLESSDPKLNLELVEFDQFVGHVRAFLAGAGIVWPDVGVRLNAEINLDYRSLALKGLKGVSLRRFRNSWAQLYQKRDDLFRAEMRVNLQDETLRYDEIGAMLASLTHKVKPQVADDEAPEPSPDPFGPEVA